MSPRVLLKRLFPFSARCRREAELDDEIRFHLEMAIEENVARGMEPGEARRQAYRSFGGVEQIKEAYRDQQGLPPLSHLGQDFRFAIRSLGRRPAFCVLAIALLGLGIGGSTAVFSLVNAVVLSPLPGADPDRVVFVQESLEGRNIGGNPARLRDWQERLTSFSTFAGFYGESPVLLNRGEPRRIDTLSTFGPYLEVVGVQPSLGRGPTEQEARGLSRNVAMISDRLWRSVFSAREGVLGEALTLDESVYDIIGVLPPGQFPREVDAWIPAPPKFQEAPRGSHYLQLIGRLQPEVSRQEAQAELSATAQALAGAFPETDEGLSAQLVEPREALTQGIRAPLLTVFLATFSLLVLACLNLAGVILARAVARRREAATRIALGAGPGRLARLYLTETLLLAGLGGSAGLVLADAGIRAFRYFLGGTLPLLGDLRLDLRVLLLALAVTFISGLVMGFAPAWMAMREDPLAGLRQSSTAGNRLGLFGPRNFLVVGQVALSMVLLVGASLLVNSFLKMTSVPLGFEPQRVLAVKTSFPWGADGVRVHRFSQELLDQMAALPGVTSVGLVDRLPLEGESQSSPIAIQNRPLPPSLEDSPVLIRAVSQEYFQAVGIPLVMGQGLEAGPPASVTPGDDPSRRGGPILINAAFARMYFPSLEAALGERVGVRWGSSEEEPEVWHPIVGIVGDVRQRAQVPEARPEAYVHFSATYWPLLSFVVKAQGDPQEYASSIRALIGRIDPSQVIDSIGPLDDELDHAVATERVQTVALGALSVLALLLAVVGLYGLLASNVAQRTREFGIRLALGARPQEILWSALRPGLLLTAVGATLGLAAALLAGKALEGLLFETEATDVASILGAGGVLALVALLVSLLPARRGARVDPALSLRHE